LSGTTNARRVLVVEDVPDIARLIEIMLTDAGYAVDVACDGAEAVDRTIELRPDVVILDAGLPQLSGVEVTERLRANVVTANVVIIFLTGRAEERLDAYRAGADDFLTKPVEPDELLVRVSAALRRAEGRRAVSPLTGLPGNLEVLRELERAIAQPRQEFALIWADLDNFKAFNDAYGFLRGDRAIVKTARLLVGEVEALDTSPRFVGHIGGDDFALVVAEAAAVELAELVVAAFAAEAPSLYDPADRRGVSPEVVPLSPRGRSMPLLSISLGVASTRDRRFSDPQEVVEEANQAKRQAKDLPGSAWSMGGNARAVERSGL
jgi:diguanylate cyclase (GGDEF)-like protein